MTRADYHVHTTWCDGKSRAEETVLSAIGLGLSELGFSGHGYTAFDTRYCMPPDAAEYRAEIAAVREKYKDKIKILCGCECDYYGDIPPWADYIIGSVHYMEIGGEYVPVDEGMDILAAAAEKHLGGDIYSLCEVYFKTVADIADKMKPDIIGHFDLITKLSENDKLFDEAHPRYVRAWQAAADRLISANIPFEINTGAISRGYRTTPYPSESQVKYIASKGGKFILSSDCHAAENLCCEFDKWRAWAEGLGAEIVETINVKKN